MLEVVKTVDSATLQKVETWLETVVRPHLKADISNYAKGRQRCWVGLEPMLGSAPGDIKHVQGLQVHPNIKVRFQDLIGWNYDYLLVTYSGDEVAHGITPHRDASYADFEAYGMNVTGTCTFKYWNGRNCFGRGPNTKEFNPYTDAPTHTLQLQPGMVTHFNCKNPHSAEPSLHRWGLNFWRAKP